MIIKKVLSQPNAARTSALQDSCLKPITNTSTTATLSDDRNQNLQGDPKKLSKLIETSHFLKSILSRNQLQGPKPKDLNSVPFFCLQHWNTPLLHTINRLALYLCTVTHLRSRLPFLRILPQAGRYLLKRQKKRIIIIAMNQIQRDRRVYRIHF